MESVLHVSRGPSNPAVRNDKPTVKSFFFSTQGKTISVRSQSRCGTRALLARTSIKSAGVAELIGRPVQCRSNLAMQEESLVKLERAPLALVDRMQEKFRYRRSARRSPDGEGEIWMVPVR